MQLTDLSTGQTRVIQTLLLISVLTLPFKGLAMWKASQLKRRMWFAVLLVVNSLGLLDIVYYFFLDTKQPAKKDRKQS